MQLLSFRHPHEALGVMVDGVVLAADRLREGLALTMGELLDGGPEALGALRRAVDAERAMILSHGKPFDPADLLAPVPSTRQIIAIGRNYVDHTSEQGAVPPGSPLVFAKFPSSIASPGADVVWSRAVTDMVDYEAELGVVIGSTARNVTVERALDHVFGYCCVNDVSARDLQVGDGQWVRSKSLDTFCPFGPVLVTADEVGDPQSLDIVCTVNGEVRQSSNTSQMFFSVAEIIAHCSRTMTLQPGDLITTGTPGGVGMFQDPPRLLSDGDEMIVEIEGLGRLVNRCRVDD